MAKQEKVAVAEPQVKEVLTSKTPKWEIKDRIYIKKQRSTLV